MFSVKYYQYTKEVESTADMDILTMTTTDHTLLSNSSKFSDAEEFSSMKFDTVSILAIIIAGVGVISNFTVIVAFVNNKKLGKKIPNIFIINQVNIGTRVVFHESAESCT